MTAADAAPAVRGWYRARLGCAAVSAAMFAGAVIVLGAATPGYSQSSDAVSRLGSPGERWALVARAVFAAYGLLVAAGAGALAQYTGRHGHWLARCLVLYAAGCAVAGVAQKNQPGTPPTFISQVHVVAAMLAGALAVGAMLLVARCGPTRAARRAAAAMALLTALAASIFRLTWGSEIYGVCERVLLGPGMCWISVLAARALTAGRYSRPCQVVTQASLPSASASTQNAGASASERRTPTAASAAAIRALASSCGTEMSRWIRLRWGRGASICWNQIAGPWPCGSTSGAVGPVRPGSST
jgi:hypothetical protein